MTSREAILKALADKKVTQTRLAEKLGYKSQGGIGNLLKGSISSDNLIKVLDELDYEVVVQPKTQGKRKDGAMVLEPSGLPDGRGKKQKKIDSEEKKGADNHV